MGRKSEMACGCQRIDQATLAEGNDWLASIIDGFTGDVKISMVVGGDRCHFYREKTNPRGVGTFGPKREKIDD